MTHYLTGNLFESPAEALVNTVNCEGYMGKGIAYQFKLRYPENNIAYEKACKSGQLHVGYIFYHAENGKTILNFPTKNKWREKSKTEYITMGLDSLSNVINDLKINSVAIPPLGSGNWGLTWIDVKNIIEDRFLPSVSPDVDIFIYEPSKEYKAISTAEPKLSLSSLVLMQIKLNLKKFNELRLQKTAFFMNIFLKDNYFRFIKGRYGPYDKAIDNLSKDIKAYQDFHGGFSTKEAYKLAYNTLISDRLDKNLKRMLPAIKSATDYVNDIEEDDRLECISTILFILQNSKTNDINIVNEFKSWSEDKAKRFSEEDILNGIEYLCETGILVRTFTGLSLDFSRKKC
ncbi:MAG: macro domain-containing protein [Ruminococcus sp.]|jgi:O-acetyl-ADP-ribose deacetylase (regulator of RNase III)|nr:macro domain-containing protein [Ruminococcus sp.]